MITRLLLEDWKSFHKSEILIDQLTFVIGRNASGKSNVVDALWLLSRLGRVGRLNDVAKDIRGGIEQIIRKGSKKTSLTVTLRRGKAEYRYCLELALDNNELYVSGESLAIKGKNGFKTFYEVDEAIIDSNLPVISVRFLRDGKGPKRKIALRRDMTVLSQVAGLTVIKEIKEAASAVSEEFSRIFIFDPRPSLMRGVCAPSERLESDGSNMAGVISALPEEEKKAFLADLLKYVRRLPERDILDIEVDVMGRFNDMVMLYCREGWAPDQEIVTDSRSMSDGTLRFIAIVVALLTMPADSLLVIEEIDNGLHPSRAGELVHALRNISSEKNFDILCTTHNPVLVDKLGPEISSVTCVVRDGIDGSSRTVRMDDMPRFLHTLASYTPGEMMIADKFNYSEGNG